MCRNIYRADPVSSGLRVCMMWSVIVANKQIPLSGLLSPKTMPDLRVGLLGGNINYQNLAPIRGLVERGNIDLFNRPIVRNQDGSISTVRSIGVNIDGNEVLIPTVSPDGRLLSNDEAVDLYFRTGMHLGKFKTPEDSSSYAQSLHRDQERFYMNGRK